MNAAIVSQDHILLADRSLGAIRERKGASSLFISKLMMQFILISPEDRSLVLELRNILSLFWF